MLHLFSFSFPLFSCLFLLFFSVSQLSLCPMKHEFLRYKPDPNLVTLINYLNTGSYISFLECELTESTYIRFTWTATTFCNSWKSQYFCFLHYPPHSIQDGNSQERRRSILILFFSSSVVFYCSFFPPLTFSLSVYNISEYMINAIHINKCLFVFVYMENKYKYI